MPQVGMKPITTAYKWRQFMLSTAWTLWTAVTTMHTSNDYRNYSSQWYYKLSLWSGAWWGCLSNAHRCLHSFTHAIWPQALADTCWHVDSTDSSGGMVPKPYTMQKINVNGTHILFTSGVCTEDIISIWHEWTSQSPFRSHLWLSEVKMHRVTLNSGQHFL
jgi:hypothetical protein